MLIRPRHGDSSKLYYVPYLTERTTPHYLLWGPTVIFRNVGVISAAPVFIYQTRRHDPQDRTFIATNTRNPNLVDMFIRSFQVNYCIPNLNFDCSHGALLMKQCIP
jgi:hypothetical protein